MTITISLYDEYGRLQTIVDEGTIKSLSMEYGKLSATVDRRSQNTENIRPYNTIRCSEFPGLFKITGIDWRVDNPDVMRVYAERGDE